jgi:hypothetical protein
MGTSLKKRRFKIIPYIIALFLSVAILWFSRAVITPNIGLLIMDMVPQNWLPYATIQSGGGYLLSFLTLFWPLLFYLPISIFIELRFRLFLRFPLFTQSIAVGIFYFSLYLLIATSLWPFLLDNVLRSIDISIAGIGYLLILRLLARNFDSKNVDNTHRF